MATASEAREPFNLANVIAQSRHPIQLAALAWLVAELGHVLVVQRPKYEILTGQTLQRFGADEETTLLHNAWSGS